MNADDGKRLSRNGKQPRSSSRLPQFPLVTGRWVGDQTLYDGSCHRTERVA